MGICQECVLCRICDERPPDPDLDGICYPCLKCTECQIRPPHDKNKGTEYEGWCLKCVPEPAEEEPPIDYRAHTWI